jgi:hypothetical protein
MTIQSDNPTSFPSSAFASAIELITCKPVSFDNYPRPDTKDTLQLDAQSEMTESLLLLHNLPIGF